MTQKKANFLIQGRSWYIRVTIDQTKNDSAMFHCNFTRQISAKLPITNIRTKIDCETGIIDGGSRIDKDPVSQGLRGDHTMTFSSGKDG